MGRENLNNVGTTKSFHCDNLLMLRMAPQMASLMSVVYVYPFHGKQDNKSQFSFFLNKNLQMPFAFKLSFCDADL